MHEEALVWASWGKIGTNNLPSESADSCVADIKSLVLKVKRKFPNSSTGLSGIVYREDTNVDAKRIEVNERVKLIAENNNIRLLIGALGFLFSEYACVTF